jgi:hypothetical protein
MPALAGGQNEDQLRSDDTSATKEADRIASPTEAPNPIWDDLLMHSPLR